MDTGEDNLLNVGYGIFKRLYKELELDRFFNWKTRGLAIKYSLDQIFRLLVFSRLLYSGSKKGTYANREIYFDCTNYYFDIGRSDMDTLNDDGNPVDKDGNLIDEKHRKRGPEKNHRPDPIVEMGLLMDRNGIPLAFDLFPGNESEKVHMRPILNRVKKEFASARTIIVADRGLNTSDNIYFINGDNKREDNSRDGYVYGQSVRGADAEFKKWVLGGGYTVTKFIDEEGQEISFTHKSRIHLKELHPYREVKRKRRKLSGSIRNR